MDAKAIKNNDGTYKLVNLNDTDLVLDIKIGESLLNFKIKKNLTLEEMYDLKYYGVNIINYDII